MKIEDKNKKTPPVVKQTNIMIFKLKYMPA